MGDKTLIKIGDATVLFGDGFRLYMTTKLSNPAYSPETCVKVQCDATEASYLRRPVTHPSLLSTRAQVNMLNFVATRAGLTEQMLGIVVAAKAPELQRQSVDLMRQAAANSKALQDVEDKVEQRRVVLQARSFAHRWAWWLLLLGLLDSGSAEQGTRQHTG